MTRSIRETADTILSYTVNRFGGAPGVVAMATDRKGNFYWIDRKNGIGGYWGSQILPFQDIASYTGFVDFEGAVYRSRRH